MILTTIPLVSLIRPDTLCVSCDKRIRTSIIGNKKYSTFIYREFDVNDIYEYKCNSCVSDRDYNMSDRYNDSHPIKEYMGEIMMNGESFHKNIGDKVNQ